MKRQKLKRDAPPGYDKHSDESGGEETELLPRKALHREPPLIEIAVEEADTLGALSIRYGCSVAELKRFNHIHKDNEIFAKRTIKVPHRPFSEILAGVHNSGGNSPTLKPKIGAQVAPDVLQSKLHTFLSVPGNHEDVGLSSFNEVIFNSKIASKPSDNRSDDESESDDEDDDEEIHLLPGESVVTDVKAESSKFFCNESDVLWIALFFCVFVFAVPIFRMVYVSEHGNSTHYSQHHHTS